MTMDYAEIIEFNSTLLWLNWFTFKHIHKFENHLTEWTTSV